MASEFELAITQICEEKGISKEKVVETIEAALAAAFRKDYGEKGENIKVSFDIKTGKATIYRVWDVVEAVENAKREYTVDEAKKEKKGAKLGDQILKDVTPTSISFGRIAAQTAKQVITQRIREAERENIYATFKDKEKTILSGIIQRMENRLVFIDLGQTTGILAPQEQIPQERFHIGQRVKVYLAETRQSAKGPELVLSRTHPDMVSKLFEFEVPEVAAHTVEIVSIAREAGFRSKIAVRSNKEEIDPVGACVGQRGTRVQTVIAELSGEKIDIIEWNENPVQFISNSLSPAKVISVKLDEEHRHAVVEVAEDQLSLAIGRSGQNVRLAVKLTGWKIDIVKEGEETAPKPAQGGSATGGKEKAEDTETPEKKEEATTEEAKTETKTSEKTEEPTKSAQGGPAAGGEETKKPVKAKKATKKKAAKKTEEKKEEAPEKESKENKEDK